MKSIKLQSYLAEPCVFVFLLQFLICCNFCNAFSLLVSLLFTLSFFSIIINIIFEIEKSESSFSQSFCSFSVVWRDSKLQLQIILKWNFLGNYELCFLLVISSLYDSIDVFSILQDPHFVISYWGFPIPKMSVLKIMVKYFWWKIFV